MLLIHLFQCKPKFFPFIPEAIIIGWSYNFNIPPVLKELCGGLGADLILFTRINPAVKQMPYRNNLNGIFECPVDSFENLHPIVSSVGQTTVLVAQMLFWDDRRLGSGKKLIVGFLLSF